MTFFTPDDLTVMNARTGQCYSQSVRQHVKFGYQNVPFQDAAAGTKMPFLVTLSSVMAATGFVIFSYA